MPKSRKSKRRSGCPLNACVEMFGDHWSLLILRDMMLRGARTYREFLKSPEGIATNILADRLRKLACDGIIAAKPDASDHRNRIYLLTAKGMDLGPVLMEMAIWASRYENTTQQPLVRKMQKDKQGFLNEARRRWRQAVSRSRAR